MYSMFDLLFETPSYRPVYVISDSEMKELKKNQHQEELDEITKQNFERASYRRQETGQRSWADFILRFE